MIECIKKQRFFLICLTLIAAIIAAFEPIRYNGYIDYDDPSYITKNINVTKGITIQSIIRAFTASHAGNWHPLTWLSHMLDYELFGLNPVGHHSVSVFFHILNTLLVFWIFNSITGATPESAFMAAVFALHPLQVESVAWAAERKTVLSGFFWFLTIAVYIWYTRNPCKSRYLAVFAIYGLCIMTKPVVITLPLILLLLDYWPLNRLSLTDYRLPIENNKSKTINLKSAIIEKIPLLSLSVILGILTLVAQKYGGAIFSFKTFPFECRVANIFVSYIKYIGKTLWPSKLAVFYPYQQMNIFNLLVIICFFSFIILTTIIIYATRWKKYLVVGWLWFVITLIPMIGLIQAGLQSMANRYMYLSILGLLIIITFAAKDIIAVRAGLKAITMGLANIILILLLIITRKNVKYWQNDITLFGYAVQVTTNNVVAENGYGRALALAGHLNEAESHLKNAFRIDPSYNDAIRNLGITLLEQGKTEEAADCFIKLLHRDRTNLNANLGLSTALIIQNKCHEGAKYFIEALKSSSRRTETIKMLVTELTKLDKLDDAIINLNESLKSYPDEIQIYIMLGEIYTQLRNYKSAIHNFSMAANLNVNDVNILNSLSWLLATTGEITTENTNKAIELSRRACELTMYKRAEMLDTLAASLAAARKFDEAIRVANQAVNYAEVNGQRDLANEIRDRLKLYKAGLRYRQQ